MGGSETSWHPRERSYTRRWQEHLDAFACGAAPSWHKLDCRRDTDPETSTVSELDGGSHGLAFSDRSEDQR